LNYQIFLALDTLIDFLVLFLLFLLDMTFVFGGVLFFVVLLDFEFNFVQFLCIFMPCYPSLQYHIVEFDFNFL